MSGILQRLSKFRSVIFPLIFYFVLFQLAHTLLYTIVTYMVTLSHKAGPEFSNTVNEISSQYLLLAIALSSLLVTATLWKADLALYRATPFWNEAHRPFWRLDRVRKEELLRGLSNGLIGAGCYLIVMVAVGQISYLGVYITSTIGTPIFPLFFVDLLALCALVICEEYLFRHKILRGLLDRMPAISATLLTSVLHLLARHFQFQLVPLDYLNLFCLNLILGFFYVKSGKPQRGIGFQLALLCLLHNFGGLSLWGFESPSFFLFKASSRASEFFSGGDSGPLAGTAFTALLMSFLLAAYFTWKRELEARRHAIRFR